MTVPGICVGVVLVGFARSSMKAQERPEKLTWEGRWKPVEVEVDMSTCRRRWQRLLARVRTISLVL